MIDLLASIKAEPVYLMSIAKPLVMLALLVGWAWLVGQLDKDAGFYFARQKDWALGHIGAGILGFGLLLIIPIFWIGLPVALIILGGEIFGYITYRNKKVDESKRWSAVDIWNMIQGKRVQKKNTQAKERAKIKLLDKSEALLDVPHGTDPRTPAFELFESMLMFAIPRGADLLSMTLDAEKAKFNARVDGIRYSQEAPEPQLCMQLIEYLKEHAGMDTADKRRKQKGTMWVEVEGSGKHTLQLTTSGSTRALSLAIEIDPDGRLDIPINFLGFLPAQKKTIDKLLEMPNKTIIFASPPRCGTTTSLYSFLQKHDPYTSSVMTYEKQIAFDVEGVNHNTHPEGASPDQIVSNFASLLRSDPDVMMVTHVINSDMAQMIAKASEDTRFYLPLPAKDSLTALKLWIKAVGDKRLAAESIAAIISQRLVRRLCHTCRAPYIADDAALKKLNVPADKVDQLFKASGKVMVKDRSEPCPDCHGLCFKGRIAAYEVLVIDQHAQNYIASGEGERLAAHMRKSRMLFLEEAGLAKVVEGISDIKEVTRVMAEVR